MCWKKYPSRWQVSRMRGVTSRGSRRYLDQSMHAKSPRCHSAYGLRKVAANYCMVNRDTPTSSYCDHPVTNSRTRSLLYLASKYVQGAWFNDENRHSYVWQPPCHLRDDTAPIFKWFQRPEIQAGDYFGRFQRCFQNGTIRSFTMPYCGNLAAFCAIPWTFMTLDHSMFSASLRRVSINLMVHREMRPVFDTWIYRCPNLEFLEIALCRPPDMNLDCLSASILASQRQQGRPT